MFASIQHAQVDLVLMGRLLRYICGVEPYGKGSNGSEAGAVKGAVLVFLPVRHVLPGRAEPVNPICGIADASPFALLFTYDIFVDVLAHPSRLVFAVSIGVGPAAFEPLTRHTLAGSPLGCHAAGQ